MDTPKTEVTTKAKRKPFNLPFVAVVAFLVGLGIGVVATWVFASHYLGSTKNTEESVRVAKASPKPTTTASPTPTVPSVSNTPVEAAQAYQSAHSTAQDSTYHVVIEQDPFADVDINIPSSGYFVIEKIINNQWSVIYAGQNTPPQAIIDQYGIPAAIVNG